MIKRKQLEDAWGEEFQITTDDDGNFIVFSKGRDKQAGTKDDVFRDGGAADTRP